MKQIKKYDKDEALAKIKALISNFYEEVGRQNIEDTNEARQEIIENIDEILNATEISTRHLIIEKLQLDDEVNKSLLKNWK